MDINDVKALIIRGETKTLELKKSTVELKDAMHTACAFLNTDGGWLVFGVTPTTLKVIGQEVTDNTRREIAHALTGIEPAIDVTPEYIEIPESNGKMIIAIHFTQWIWGMRPYTFQGRPNNTARSRTERWSERWSG